MTLFISFRNSRAGILIRENPFIYRASPTFELKTLDDDIFRSEISGRDVLLAVHGYNNSEEEAVCALSRLSLALALSSEAVFIGVLWPGDSLIGFLSYPVERPTARHTGIYLAAFCNQALSTAASISFASHSLGARVVLEAIRHMDRETRSACLMAAAIERNCFEKEYADAFARAQKISVLSSEQDWVLKRGFPVGNLVGNLLDPTSNPLSTALGFAGPEKAVGQTTRPWQITSTDNYRHGNYLPSSQRTGRFPPEMPSPVTDEYRDAIKYAEPAAFIRRAFYGERQTWPVPG